MSWVSGFVQRSTEKQRNVHSSRLGTKSFGFILIGKGQATAASAGRQQAGVQTGPRVLDGAGRATRGEGQ